MLLTMTTPIKTPLGLVMPAVAYAAVVAAAITAGTALVTIQMAYPVWIWPVFFLVMWMATAGFTRATAKPAAGSKAWQVNNVRALGFAILGAVLLGAALTAAFNFV